MEGMATRQEIFIALGPSWCGSLAQVSVIWDAKRLRRRYCASGLGKSGKVVSVVFAIRYSHLTASSCLPLV